MNNNNTAIIICSRLTSSRVPKKAMLPINGVPVLEHLINRLKKTDLNIYLAVPPNELKEYKSLQKDNETFWQNVFLVGGDENDPLARLYEIASNHNIKNIIRVNHDKIFVDDQLIRFAVGAFRSKNLDYLYSSHFTPGSGFEIISFESLERAAMRFKNVEHVSYAIRAVTNNVLDYQIPEAYRSKHRLLIDYPEDVTVIETILASVGNESSLLDVIDFCNKNKWLGMLNNLPKITVYTCAYNAEKYIERAMGSVSSQKIFGNCEYIIIDDFSNDDTPRLAAKFSSLYRNVRFIRNEKNIGLASSSNRALKYARGEYIIRLDADDFLINNSALDVLSNEIESRKLDAVYPNHYLGSMQKVEQGNVNHHIGGTIFKTSAINHLKFTEELRGHDSLDVFLRAKSLLKIGYLNKAVFFYRQHEDSLSKNNLEARELIKQDLLSKHG